MEIFSILLIVVVLLFIYQEQMYNSDSKVNGKTDSTSYRFHLLPQRSNLNRRVADRIIKLVWSAGSRNITYIVLTVHLQEV